MVDNTPELSSQETSVSTQDKFKQERPMLYVSGQVAEQKIEHGRNIISDYKESHPDAGRVFQQVDETGKEVEQQFGEKEFQHLRNILQEIAPVTVFNYQDWMNANMMGRVARELAAQVGVNPDHAAAATLLQNLIKTTAGSQFNRSFLVAKQMFANDIRSDLLHSLVEPSLFAVDDGEVEGKIAALPLEKKVVMMATLLGKRTYNSETGVAEGVVPLDEAIAENAKGLRYDNLMSQLDRSINKDAFQFQSLEAAKMYEAWPSEKKYNANVPQVAEHYFRSIADQLKQQRVDLPALQQSAAEKERTTGEKVVVFDLGGLAQESPGIEPMLSPIARMLGQDEKSFGERFEKYYAEHHYDFTSPDEFINRMIKIFAGETVRLQPDQVQIIRDVYLKSVNPRMDQSMVDAIGKLRTDHKKVPIVAFTNTTPDHAVVNKDGLYSFFDQVVRSDTTHGSKGNKKDFMLICAQFDLPVNSFVFLDDNKGNVDRANEIGIHAIQMDKFGHMDEFLPQIEENLHVSST